jgi:hypothetical protein
VDNDPSFGSPEIKNVNTELNSYTHLTTLANGTYYWRVRVRRYEGVFGSWSVPEGTCPSYGEGCFTLTLPSPTGLYHMPAGVVGRAPTLCWTPLITSSNAGDPVLAAYKYAIQLSKEPTFSDYEYFQTEQNCWTRLRDPLDATKAFEDGLYYWRVAMIDGDDDPKTGAYSAYETFTKQYPTTTLVSPLSGGVSGTPTFRWTPVIGAAYYRIQTATNETFTPYLESIKTVSTSYTPLVAYINNTTYYWRVAVMDYDENHGPYNDATIILETYPNHIYMPQLKKLTH